MKRDASSVSPVGGGGGVGPWLYHQWQLYIMCVCPCFSEALSRPADCLWICVCGKSEVFLLEQRMEIFSDQMFCLFSSSFFSFLLYFFPGWRRDVRTFTSQDSRSTKNLDVSTLPRSHRKQKTKTRIWKKMWMCFVFVCFWVFFQLRFHIVAAGLRFFHFCVKMNDCQFCCACVFLCPSVFALWFFLNFYFFICLGEGVSRGRAAKKEKKKSPTFLKLSVCL